MGDAQHARGAAEDAVIEVAGPEDARAILGLVEQAGWAYNLPDIDRLLRLDREAMLVALPRHGKREVVGCVYASKWGHLGFIGLLLVKPDRRGRGMGERLVMRGIIDLERRGCAAVGLDAVPEAVPLYLRVGFTPFWESMRFAIDTTIDDRPAARSRAREATDADMPLVLELDLKGWGADRGRLLTAMRQETGARIIVAPDAGASPVGAFAALRRGPRSWRMGPWIAGPGDGGRDAALAVLAAAVDSAAGEPISLGVPAYARPAIEALNRLYAVRYRSCTRMYRGAPGPVLLARGSWGIGAPEKG